MPLHEPPLQGCGSEHWLTEPCPRGECEQMEFRGRDFVPVRRAQEAPKVERLEAAKEAVEVAVKREAMTAAERQKRYREKQKLKREMQNGQ